MVAVPSPDSASVANQLELLFERDSMLFLGSNIINRKSIGQSKYVLISKRVYLGVKTNHYPQIIRKLIAEKWLLYGLRMKKRLKIHLWSLETGRFVISAYLGRGPIQSSFK